MEEVKGRIAQSRGNARHSAHAAEELSEQAKRLRQLIERFKLLSSEGQTPG